MIQRLLPLAALSMAMIVVGTVFGIWFGFDPAPLSASAYVEVQQEMIRALNVKMPILGGIAILLTAGCAYVSRANRRALALLVGATACFVVMGIVTRFFNQPINAIVVGWSPASPPADWSALRDEWWSYHIVRLIAGTVGFFVLVLGVLIPSAEPPAVPGGAPRPFPG